jgi:sulfatase maturation enzyme AslB (radical SAM superfamily)
MDNSSSLFSRQLIDVCKRSVAKYGGMSALAKLAFQRRQALRRQAAERRGDTVPSVLIASVTRKCNLDCAGCYAKRIRPEDKGSTELSDDGFMELFEEASRLGVGAILVAGGEPLLRPGLLKRIAAMHGIVAPVFTNGTLLDDEAVRLFGPESSLVPVFSIEGDELFTSERRGSGVHKAVLAGIGRVRDNGGLFGLSVTVTSRNADLVLSTDFLRALASLGASTVFLVEYVPVAAGTESFALDKTTEPAQRARSWSRSALPHHPAARRRGGVRRLPCGRPRLCPHIARGRSGGLSLRALLGHERGSVRARRGTRLSPARRDPRAAR